MSCYLVCGLTSRCKCSLISCHRFSMWFISGDFGGVFHQLIPFLVKKKSGCVLRIIVLGKTVCGVRIYINEWLQGVLEYIDIHSCIHFPLKYTDSCSSSHTTPFPHVHLQGVLGSRYREINRHGTKSTCIYIL